MEERIEFRGGAWMSVVPLAVFIAATACLVIAGAPEVEGIILAAMAGISIGMPPACHTPRLMSSARSLK